MGRAERVVIFDAPGLSESLTNVVTASPMKTYIKLNELSVHIHGLCLILLPTAFYSLYYWFTLLTVCDTNTARSWRRRLTKWFTIWNISAVPIARKFSKSGNVERRLLHVPALQLMIIIYPLQAIFLIRLILVTLTYLLKCRFLLDGKFFKTKIKYMYTSITLQITTKTRIRSFYKCLRYIKFEQWFKRWPSRIVIQPHNPGNSKWTVSFSCVGIISTFQRTNSFSNLTEKRALLSTSAKILLSPRSARSTNR